MLNTLKKTYIAPCTRTIVAGLPLMKDWGDWISNIAEPEASSVSYRPIPSGSTTSN